MIGPGGRPKTSSGKHGNVVPPHSSTIIHPTGSQNSRLTHYSANAPGGKSQSIAISKNGTQQLRGQKLNQQYAGHQRSSSTQENYQNGQNQSEYAPELVTKSGVN